MNLPRVDTLLINANRTNGKQLRTGEEAVEYVKPYFENAKTPSIHLVQLNVQCKILRSNTITVKAFENHHREILSDLLLNNAQQVIVCDNYKNIAKSQKLSNKIKEYLKYPQIRLIDYINLPQKIHFNDMNYDEDIYYSNNDEINLNSRYIEQNIKLVEEGYLDVKSGSLSDTLESLYKDLRKRTREEVVTLNIDEDLKPINYIVSSIGTIDRSLASSFELLKGSIMSGARNVILLHNHPGGSNYPSKGDIEMTRNVQEAYNFMGINFYDHHIVGSKVYSFKENGLLDEMRDKQSVKFESANVNIQKADINVGETVKTHEGEKYVIGKNNEKYILFDASDKEKKYQVVENIFYDKVTQKYSWEFGETIDSLQMATNLIYNSYDDIKRSISFYCGSKHKEYFKSVMSIENSIEDENILDNIYHEYMNNDMQLVNPDLKDLKDDASKKYDNEEETYYKHELDYERE